ncbi:alcohol oxidase-like protein [Schizophyllum commune H4-8]|uniref:alcohol oxidase-like protein n=1 Tax=Schizophyllum commune (strain H4-8 / FGSC 9210) TaxID=578458 RepID=UPI00215E2495|nr:alcohol oxidase-like protein [Schizophyllum commune H4-8]KAI5886021.1 alcohol oxidase-like protein [Schizophyllum commune H4-8]
MPANKEYDIIFAGAGTAACVAAGRLAAADPTLRILLLEAGPHTLGLAAHIEPYRFVTHLVPESLTVTPYASTPSPAVGGRSIIVPAGHCVGGGSSVNFMMYTRAAASDYNDWGAPGWTADELLPLLKKTETYQEEPNQPTHGYSGPLKVSYGGQFMQISKDFLDVAAVYDKERKASADINTLYECDGYGRWPKWIDKETGKRSDPAHHYIYNKVANTNLQVVAGARVVRVLFEEDRARGVEFVTENKPDSPVNSVYASRLVVLSAGSFGSPAILERSGIGSAMLLEKLGVPVKVNLPGVGENYQDHHLMHVTYHASDETETLDDLLLGEPEEIAYWQKMYAEGKGLMAHNGIDAGIKIRPTAAERATMGPAFAVYWDEFFERAPDKPLLAISCSASPVLRTDPSLGPKCKVFKILYYTLYPKSVGHTHISSATDAHAPPVFESGYLEDSGADVAALVWGYRRSRELARRLPAYRGELASTHPIFAARTTEGPTVGSSGVPLVKLAHEDVATDADTELASNLAATPMKDLGAKSATPSMEHSATNAATRGPFAGRATGPVPIDAPDIAYSAEDEKAIEEWARSFVQTAWHSLGTCAMKPREDGGVVDARLNVYGVHGLKVVDLSIAPLNVGANTCSTALVVGEKAAMIIAEDLGIKGV